VAGRRADGISIAKMPRIPCDANDNRLRPDDGYDVNNAREAAIEPNEQRTVNPTQIQSAWGAMLQDSELMPQNQDFGLQPLPRFEAVAQQADQKAGNCNHTTIML
jgi:hypothetical protein